MTTIEGVVVDADTYRRRERNAVRAFDALETPADVEVYVRQELAPLDGASIAARVTAQLAHSRAGLLTAIAAQDLPQIVEWKKKAAAIQEIAKQVRMGKEFQLDATEFVRRAERGLGVAIREGQSNGTVETTSEGKARGSLVRDHLVTYEKVKPKPTDFAGIHELSNTHGGIYDLADGVTDEVFEEVLAEAKSEGNLSRANVVRKAKAKVAIDATDPQIDADVAPQRKVRKTAAGRKVMESIVVGIASLEFIVGDTDPAEIDYEAHKADIEGIRQGINAIRAFLTNIEKGK